ncbi:MAG TPA: NAD-dependent epimerase/dehydratase family protein [Lautropia sp.]|nr:NAD-dependent epimerase/dehydratase family protein [Lautropia sp.]
MTSPDGTATAGDPPRSRAASGERIVITGGAGFIGSNLANRLLASGQRVLILDNLSRPGVEQNLAWLRDLHGPRLDVAIADVRDREDVLSAINRAHTVFHFAAQVAVTTSLVDPQSDFAINAQGTLNVLEAARAQAVPPRLVFTSTNKVYGGLEDLQLARRDNRYQPELESIRASGIGETRPLDFHSPYGCSKGAADQYVIDYARSFGVPGVVFRMSCIYGPRQFGTEDQGWVAHFLIRAMKGEPITLYGDGMQVRDILYVDDLVDALLLAARDAPQLAGKAFNLGGGPGNVISLLDLLDRLRTMLGHEPAVGFEDWRTGDQRYYVSDFRRFRGMTGWSPKVGAEDGIQRLYRWLEQQHAVVPPSGSRAVRMASVAQPRVSPVG